MIRWRLEIEELGPIFHYLPGEQNVVTEALSRLPVYAKKTTDLGEATATRRVSPLLSGATGLEEKGRVCSKMAAAKEAE
ncbi:hypothetical protein DVH05_001392 [Phytophthora capsici]|nr:hypothetical protein DVH05_001392 [Phytophthora capsici]